MEMRQVTPNVYFGDTSAHGSNPGFVITSEGVVMIDTPMLPTDALSWKDEIERRHGRIRYIINTGYHPDHVAGNYFFPGTVISHRGVREVLTGPLERVSIEAAKVAKDRSMGLREAIVALYEKWDPKGLQQFPAVAQGYRLKLPDITFSQRLTLHLGDHAFELIHLPGHTPYEIGVYVPRERAVFTGDNFTNGVYPTFHQSRPFDLIESLKKIEALDVDFILPGHGEVGDKRAVRQFASFVQDAVDTVRKFIEQGRSQEEAADAISFGGKLPARHPSPEETRLNVLRLYEVLSKELQ